MSSECLEFYRLTLGTPNSKYLFTFVYSATTKLKSSVNSS